MQHRQSTFSRIQGQSSFDSKAAGWDTLEKLERAATKLQDQLVPTSKHDKLRCSAIHVIHEAWVGDQIRQRPWFCSGPEAEHFDMFPADPNPRQ